MSPESYYRRRANHVFFRLGLNDWTDLPAKDTPEWETLTQLFEAVCRSEDGGLVEMERTDADLYFLLKLPLDTSVEAIVGRLQREMEDPHWQPFIDFQRCAWVGDLSALSLRPGERLADQSLEHPSRRWKREDLERRLKRPLPLLHHEADSPEEAGLQFVAAVLRPQWAGTWVVLHFHELSGEEQERRAAALLNTRLRIPGTRPLLESTGDLWGSRLPGLYFSVPQELAAEPPGTVEVWWATDARRQVGGVPCYPEGTVPEALDLR